MGNRSMVGLRPLTPPMLVRIQLSQPILWIALLFATPSFATTGAQFLQFNPVEQTGFVEGTMDQYVRDPRVPDDQSTISMRVASCLYQAQITIKTIIEGTEKIFVDDPKMLTKNASLAIVTYVGQVCPQ